MNSFQTYFRPPEGNSYPGFPDKKRIYIPPDKLHWDVHWTEYDPPEFTSEKVLGENWSDPDISNAHPNAPRKALPKDLKFNEIDEGVNRKSCPQKYILQNTPSEELPLYIPKIIAR